MNGKKRYLIFLNLLITCIATSFLQTALSAALPPIISEFGIGAEKGQWLTSAYSLVMGITMPFTAFLITRYPTKRLYLCALLILAAGLVLGFFAGNFYFLLIGRIFQACSNGITTSLAQVVLLSIFPKERKGSAMGWYGLAVGAAPVIAPTIAGIFVDTIGWRMIFLVTLIIILLAFFTALLTFENVLETEIKKFDLLSFILSAFAFGGVSVGLGNLGSGFRVDTVLLPLLIGAVAGVFFVFRQLHIEVPFLELRVFQNRNFSVSVIESMLLYCVMMGGSVIMPLYIQTIQGKSATISGIVTLPGSLAMAIFSPFTGKLYDKFGMKRLAVCSAGGLAIGSFGMCAVSEDTSLWLIVFLFIIRNLAITCAMMPLVTWGVTAVDSKDAASGNALITSLRTIAGGIGSAVFVGIMTSVGQHEAGASGVNVAFGGMTIVAVVMLLTALLLIRNERKSTKSI